MSLESRSKRGWKIANHFVMASSLQWNFRNCSSSCS
jgi:hypothetical protein